MVVESRAGAAGGDDLDYFMERGPIELEPVTAAQAHAARRAWRRFGKGNHPAGLNFGDCFAYALAEVTQEPLLFKGEDFSLTDVEVAFGWIIISSGLAGLWESLMICFHKFMLVPWHKELLAVAEPGVR